MRFILFLLFSLILIFPGRNCYTQVSNAGQQEADELISELSELFNNIDNRENKKQCLEQLETFKSEWASGIFSPEEKEGIYKNCGLMIKKKIKPFPQFYDYLITLSYIKKSRESGSNLMSFTKSLQYIMNSAKSRQVMDYLETISKLFVNNVIYQTSTTQWVSDDQFDSFVFDTIPYFVYTDVNLICYYGNDSLVINDTDGKYYPLELKWAGRRGKVEWEKAGLKGDSVYAKLSDYTIKVKQNKYAADSVQFYYKEYFSKPLSGRLEDKVQADAGEDKTSYPRFESYDKHIEIKNMFKDVDFMGGFSLNGSRIIGKGDKQQNATLTFMRHKKLGQIEGTAPKHQPKANYSPSFQGNDSVYKFIVLGSKLFSIFKNHIASQKSSVTIYNGSDSIFHPGLRMKFNAPNRELSLLRYEEGLTQSPYYDTYHQIDMYFEEFNWKMDENRINFQMIKGPGQLSEANFQSFNFFTLDKFYKIQGMDDVNPLYEIKDYSLKNKTRIFFLDEYARYYRKDVNTIKALLLTLSNMGFLIYDLDNDKITVKERLFYYLLAKQKKTDYDVIEFNSLISGNNSNASLNIDNFDLIIRGVERVSVSDSQRVYIFPEGKELVLKRNRDFNFNGRVHAGFFDFFGKQFSFDYNNFKLNLPGVDSMTFMVKSFQKDAEGRTRLVRVKSVIEGVSGDLEIDNPKNKSGLFQYPNFPVLNSTSNSFVYYSKKNIQNGVYTREKFFFKIYPFTIDSLDNFETEHLFFAGILNSGGIFPDIEEPLKVQPDYSLGFIKKTPDDGYPAYSGKGVFINKVNLSNKGLRGDGTLNYLTSVTKSPDFIFFPDSMNCIAENYLINEQKSNVEYPYVSGQNVSIHWLPMADMMRVSSNDKPISMYNDQAAISGRLFLSPSLLKGSGIMALQSAEIESKVFKYKNSVFDADSADFRLKSFDQKEMAFVTQNYKSHIDFTARIGEFTSNGSKSKVQFPLNQYICFMDKFFWHMDSEELALSQKNNTQLNTAKMSQKEIMDIDLAGTGSRFVSTNPAQDSLDFISPKARYNIKDYIIYAEQVELIKVADATVFPDKGLVTIFRKAEMKTLEKSTVIANNATKYHRIYDATVNVLGKNKYTGSGNYDYLDENNNAQQINFRHIDVDDTRQTYAIGFIAPPGTSADTTKLSNTSENLTDSIIPEPAKNDSILRSQYFHLSDAFEYIGQVKLVANSEFLVFKGAVRINQGCDSLYTWIKCNIEVNPKEIYIPVSEYPKDNHRNQIFAGMMFSSDTAGVYSRFLYRKNSEKDSVMLAVKGYLYFDKESGEYRIASKEKLKTPSLPGNYLSLNNSGCIIKSEGRFRFASDLGRVEFNAFGSARHYIIPDSTTYILTVAADFFFNEKSMEIFSGSLKQNASLKPFELTSETYTKALYEMLGVSEADKLISEMNLGMGLKKTPPELNKAIIMSEVRLKWVPSLKAFISKGKIGIGNLGKEQINKYVEGYVMLKKRKTGDELNIYIEASQTDWYFFNYDCRKKIMSGIAANKDFNNAITTTKPDNRKLKSKGAQDSYSYYISTERRCKEFVEMIKASNY